MRLLLILSVSLLCYPDFGYAAKRVLLSSVQTLTLHRDKFTTGRRTSPIPQLRCIDGESGCKNLPSAVQCYNKGSDGIDVQWKCEAQLPKNVQFDQLQVLCEGYDYPDDPYILAGSCGLSYSLKPAGSASSSHKRRRSSSKEEGYSTFIVVFVFLAAGFAIYACCLAPESRRRGSARVAAAPSAPPPPSYRDDAAAADDAPPPYTAGPPDAPQYGFRPEYAAGAGAGAQGYGGAKYPSASAQAAPPPPQTHVGTEESGGDSGPGFWSGAAIGGLAGYLFGSSGNRGGGGGYYQQQRHYGHDSWRYHGDTGGGGHYSSSSSSSASDTTPVTRTGFASTRRR